jgi:hypothetical protein
MGLELRFIRVDNLAAAVLALYFPAAALAMRLAAEGRVERE